MHLLGYNNSFKRNVDLSGGFKQKKSPSKKFNQYLVVVGVEILEDVDADDDKELDVDALKTMIYMTIF